MSKTPRYTERSEYGGGDGGNYLTPARTPRQLSTSERARLLRSEMQHPGAVGETAPTVYDPATNPDPRSEQVVPGFRP